MQQKKALGYWKLWSANIGFFGIQFGWGLQLANMSAIYEVLGATPSQIPMLWLAAPLTGLLVQPIIGQMSDHTWFFRGRRRPYLLVGALLSSLSLLLMPFSTTLIMAAILLWLLDGSVNVSMGPFRALMADILPPWQRTKGYAIQGLLVALGSVVASAMPWILSFFYKNSPLKRGQIPHTVQLSFWIGAAVFLLAILWTVFSTKEYPPVEPLQKEHKQRNLLKSIKQILAHSKDMPKSMRQLAWVQIFSWSGLFCMFLYFPVAVAHQQFRAPNETSPLYAEGIEFAGLCFAFYSVVWFIVSFFLPFLAKTFTRRGCHCLCLVLGALGLLSVILIENKYLLLLSMTGVGIAVASIQTMPFAILADALPHNRMGVYMGLFNLFITIPEILISLCFGALLRYLLHDNRSLAVTAGGVFMLLAALLCLRVEDKGHAR